MFSRPLAFVLLALACVTAAAGSAYVATRHNAEDVAAAVSATPASAPAATTVPAADPAAPSAVPQPVAETEAPVTAPKVDAAPAKPTPVVAPARKEPAPVPTARPATRVASAKAPAAAPAVSGSGHGQGPKAPAVRTVPMNGGTPTAAQPPAAAAAAPPPAPEPVRPLEPQPEAPRPPQFEEVIVPASSVIGLQLESTLSSERARLEDRVDARVTRDVLAGGRVAIPAGSRVLGSVTVVERGGKVKERARLGVRFHTLILADGSEVPLHTDAVFRDGESPAGDSAKKIGGAAVGGAILGAILGGSKGAAIGGATGAAGGTAMVMQGDRSPATLSRGEVLTAKLSAPATITLERRE
jgi:hypothetical protein